MPGSSLSFWLVIHQTTITSVTPDVILLHIHILSLPCFHFLPRQERARTELATRHLLVYQLLGVFSYKVNIKF